MPITDRNIRETMAELEASSGGSLVKHLQKLQITDNRSILFIGLGGLGSKAVNAIKSVYLREYEYSGRVRFLAVDTDVEDQKDIMSGHVDSATGEIDGFMSGDELFQVYEDSSVGLLTNFPRPPAIEGWIGNLEPRALDASGAQGIRQIGRVMLCGTQKYQQLRGIISSNVSAIHSTTTPVNVVVVAGIAGGTGSGTFIDVSYMVRDILANMAAHDNQVYQWGVFFTPEVQHDIPDIYNNPVIWSSLQRNGYAALKELDYFMSNGSMAAAKAPIYRLSTPGGLVVQSGMPIYNEGTVFLVSGNGHSSCEEIVAATARSVLNMFQKNTAAGNQAFTSDASNIPNYFNTWRNNNVGIDVGGAEAPLGIDGAEFPVFMNYHYLSPGYASVYFPRDEILAYCANEVMIEINDVWRGAARLNQKSVDSWLKACGFDSPEGLLAASKTAMDLRAEELRLNSVSDAAAWPEVTMFLFGYGHVRGTGASMVRAQQKADQKVKAIDNDRAVVQLASRLTEGLTSRLGSMDFISNWGPYAAIAALTGYGDLRGACDRLDVMPGKLRGTGGFLERLQAAETAAKANMEEAARILEADNTPTEREVEVFVDACQEYSLARFDLGFARGLMERVIRQANANLMDYNNRTFATYVPVMEALTEMLNRDSTVIATTDHEYHDGRETFGMDAFGLSQVPARRQQFMDLFAPYVSRERAGMVAASFARMMFGMENRDRWQQLSGRPDLLAAEVRKAFSDFFAPFANDMLEKFAVLAYGDPRQTRGLTPERLDQIWDADDGTADARLRDTAIDAAGTAIAQMLESGSAPLVELEGGQSMIDRLYRRTFITLLNGMTKLNPAILNHIHGNLPGVGYIGDDHKSVIRCVTYVGPIALPLITDASAWAREYFKAETSVDTRAGRHLDERDQDWARLLPEPFGMDAEQYYYDRERPDLVIKGIGMGDDAELFGIIRNALAYGLSRGYIFFDQGADNCYKIIHDVKETSSTVYGRTKTLRESCDAVIARDHNAKLYEILHAAQNDYFTITYSEEKLICNNGPLQGRQDQEPIDPRRFSNLCRIVRSNKDFIAFVLGAKNEYAGDAGVESNGVLETVAKAREAAAILQADDASMQKFEKRLPIFGDMLVCGLLKYSPGARAGMGKWYYRRKADAPFEELCSISGLRPGLELRLTYYLGFAKGMWILPERVCDILSDTTNRMFDNGELISADEAKALQRQFQDILDSPELSEPYEEKRDANVLSMVKASRNPGQYSVPKTIVTAADAYANIAGFYQRLIERVSVA